MHTSILARLGSLRISRYCSEMSFRLPPLLPRGGGGWGCPVCPIRRRFLKRYGTYLSEMTRSLMSCMPLFPWGGRDFLVRANVGSFREKRGVKSDCSWATQPQTAASGLSHLKRSSRASQL